MNVVFDTNILVSAFGFPGGFADKAFERVVSGRDRLFLSADILLELSGVLARKTNLNREQISQVLLVLNDAAALVRPSGTISVLKDEPDNRILECAMAAKADLIVTGDKAMLALGSYQGIRIVPLRDYLALP